MKARRIQSRRRGSAILLVVGLVVMLAMVGAMHILTSYSDRKDAYSVASAAPIARQTAFCSP